MQIDDKTQGRQEPCYVMQTTSCLLHFLWCLNISSGHATEPLCTKYLKSVAPEACIKGRENLLHPTDTVGCNYLSLPLINVKIYWVCEEQWDPFKTQPTVTLYVTQIRKKYIKDQSVNLIKAPHISPSLMRYEYLLLVFWEKNDPVIMRRNWTTSVCSKYGANHSPVHYIQYYIQFLHVQYTPWNMHTIGLCRNRNVVILRKNSLLVAPQVVIFTT